MRVTSTVLFVVLLCGLGAAADKKAARLAARASKLADSAEDSWKQFVIERDTFTDDGIKEVIATYEKAVDLFHQSLEIEEQVGLNGQIVLIARRLSKLRFAQMQRQMRKRAAERAKNPPPSPPPEDEEEKKPEPVRPPPRPPARPPRTEPEPEEEAPAPWPEIAETKSEARRGKQGLRNFLMNYYFANRKISAMISRCAVCNGTGRRRTGHIDKRKRNITIACNACDEKGAHLNVPAARKGYWLCMSPLYRSNEGNRASFEDSLSTWEADPKQVAEFLKSVKIVQVDYHGLWAELKWQEEVLVIEGKSKDKFKRTRKSRFVRIGKRWFFYDEDADRGFFSTEEAEPEER